MMLSLAVLASGCARDRPVAASYCDIASPIIWASDQELDATPAGITRQIVTHNETGERLCNW